MVMDPGVSEDRAHDEARWLESRRWGCGFLLVASFVAFLSWVANNPLVWIFAGVVGALFALEPKVRAGALDPARAWVGAFIWERLRSKPKVQRMAFSAGLPLSPFRIPWRLILVAAQLVAVVTAVFLAAHAIRSAEDRAVAAQEETEAALFRALQAEERAFLAEKALTLADATVRAQEAAETIVADAVTVIRYVPERPGVQPSPSDPSQPSLPPVLPDAIPDPVPVFADALGSLLNDAGGLLPSPS